jgi:hypothetical protein
MVPSPSSSVSGSTSGPTDIQSIALSGSHQCPTPIGATTQDNGLQSIRESIRQRKISETATNIIMQSWTGTTQKQYKHYIELWSSFCCGQQTDPCDPPVGKFLDFLVTLYDKGYKYSTLNTARSAVSAIVIPVTNQTLGSYPLVSRFMKGIFKNNPPVQKYQTTWDVQIMLNYLSGLLDIIDLDLKSLTLKLLMLIALVSAQRGQSLHMLDISFMKVAETSYEFALPDHVKQSRPGYNTPSVVLKAYPHDMALCVAS